MLFTYAGGAVFSLPSLLTTAPLGPMDVAKIPGLPEQSFLLSKDMRASLSCILAGCSRGAFCRWLTHSLARLGIVSFSLLQLASARCRHATIGREPKQVTALRQKLL